MTLRICSAIRGCVAAVQTNDLFRRNFRRRKKIANPQWCASARELYRNTVSMGLVCPSHRRHMRRENSVGTYGMGKHITTGVIVVTDILAGCASRTRVRTPTIILRYQRHTARHYNNISCARSEGRKCAAGMGGMCASLLRVTRIMRLSHVSVCSREHAMTLRRWPCASLPTSHLRS